MSVFYASFNENRKNEKFRLLNTFFPLWLARTHTHYTRHPQYYFGVMTSLLIFSLYVLWSDNDFVFLLVNGHKRHQDGRRLTILFVLLTHSPALLIKTFKWPGQKILNPNLLPVALKQINPRHVAQEIVDKDYR